MNLSTVDVDNPQSAHLELEAAEDGILTVRLRNPGRLNSWSSALRVQVALALEEAAGSDTVRGVVLTGDTTAFCAGQDLHEQTSWDPEADQMDSFERVYRAVLEFPKPVVAAIEGAAVGSGMQLALLCDLRVASDTARIGQTEVRWGMPSVTGTWLLAETVGPVKARMLSLRACLVEGDQLLQLGLVDEMVPAGTAFEVAHARVRELAAHPPAAYALTKRYCADSWQEAFTKAFAAARELHRIAAVEGHEREGAERFLARHEREGEA